MGFFLGGLVTHGGVQGWWIEPVLGSLSELPLALAATLFAVSTRVSWSYYGLKGWTYGALYLYHGHVK